MKSRFKEQLNNNRGVALSMVIVLLFVMTVLGSAMYAYSMQSLKVLQFGTSRQKAEYLARSGIEASVFMYQDAMLQYDDVPEIHEFIDASTHDDDNTTDETITSNWVYLLKDGKTYVDGGADASPTPPAEPYIGCFRVTVTNDKKTYSMPKPPDNTPVEKTEYIKRFTAVGRCGGAVSTKKAYIVPLVDITGKGWVSEQGILQLDKAKDDETSIIETGTISIDCGLIDKLVTQLGKWFDPEGKYIKGRVQNQPMQLGCTSGNMVIAKPKDSETIRFAQDGKDHISGFITLSNLFVECNLDVQPEKTHFNALYLRGNQIVIDGEINMYVYDPGVNPDTVLGMIGGVITKIARNYRFSTVVLGTPSSKGTTVTDPMPTALGGLGACGKVYFGDNVYVNIITRNATRKYKIFSAGDICYFDGDFMLGDVYYGVDLLKYFLDTRLEEREYAETVLTQLERIRAFYYPEEKSKDFYSNYAKDGKTPSMRKIDVKKNGYDSIVDTILPSSGDASYIIWE